MNIFYVLGGVLTAGSSVGLIIVDSRWGIRETWNLYSNKRRQNEIIELHNIALGKGEGSVSRTTSAMRKHPLDMTINKFRVAQSSAKVSDSGNSVERSTPLLSGVDKPVLSAEEIATFTSDTAKSTVSPKRASVVRSGVRLTDFKGTNDKLVNYMRKASSKGSSEGVDSQEVSSSSSVGSADSVGSVEGTDSAGGSSSVSGLSLRPNTSMLHSSGILAGGDLLEDTHYGSGFDSADDVDLEETSYGVGFDSGDDADLEETSYGGGFDSSDVADLEETSYAGGFDSGSEGELEETKYMVAGAEGVDSSDLSDSRSLAEILGSVDMDIVDIDNGSIQGAVGDTGGYSSNAPRHFSVSSIYNNIEL